MLPYVSPAVLAVVVVLGLILIVLVFVKLGLSIKSGQCRLPAFMRRDDSGGEQDEEAYSPPFTLGQYQLPPDYSDAVSNPVYMPNDSRGSSSPEKTEENMPPDYDRVIKGEFVQLQSHSSRDIELLRDRLEAASDGEGGCANNGYVSDSDVTFRTRRQVSLDPSNMNLAGNGDIVGVTDSYYLHPPGDDENGPPPYISRPSSRQPSTNRSVRRSFRLPSIRRRRHSDSSSSAAIDMTPNDGDTPLNPAHLAKLESRIIRTRLQARRVRGSQPGRVVSAPGGGATWISNNPEPLSIMNNNNRTLSSEA